MKRVLIEVKGVGFVYGTDSQNQAQILHNLNFKIFDGEFVAIQGPSGSGKSTILYLLGCLVPVQTGEITIGGVSLSDLSEDELALFRNKNLGFVFQQFHLLPRTSVLNNILLPSKYPVEIPKGDTDLNERALYLAKQFGIEDRLSHGPQQLSGGQQQRVAIARALLNDAMIILADEPTGNLDSKSALVVLAELKKLQEQGKTVVLITHDQSIAAQADRRIIIQDGTVLKEEACSNATELEPVRLTRPRISFQNPIRNLQLILPMAWENIFRNKLRSALTMIGISIGVASVLAMITLGQFARDKILSSYAELGVNTLSFRGNQNWEQKAIDKFGLSFSGFSWEKDLLPLKDVFPEVLKISPLVTTWGDSYEFGGKTLDQDTRLVGINEDTFLITNRALLKGSPVSIFHVDNRSPVCLIGTEVMERLFANVEPIGEVLKVTVDNVNFGCRIIGVASPLSGKNDNRNPNLEIYLPFTFYQSIMGSWWRSQIRDVLMEINETQDIEKTGQGIQAFFERKYGSSGRFRANADSILIGQMNRFLNIFSTFLASIALISLAVGGIGIANMMLVSVSERYREIGLRKAVGATNTSIRKQFLAEAILLCTVAGILGLVFGFIGYETIIWGGSKLIPKFEFAWIINYQALLISSVAILTVGILSGFVPAIRAEKLSPLAALRSE